MRERVAADRLALPDEMIFVDEEYDGATLVRPTLEQLRDLAVLRGLARLYVLAPDRLARKYIYQVLLVGEFERAGVEVIKAEVDKFCTDGRPSVGAPNSQSTELSRSEIVPSADPLTMRLKLGLYVSMLAYVCSH